MSRMLDRCGIPQTIGWMLVILLVMTLGLCHSNDDAKDPLSVKIDRSKYVDPGDMINFDYNKYVRQLEEEREREEAIKNIPKCKDSRGITREDYDAVKKELLDYKSRVKEMQDIIDNKEGSPRVDAFFKRLANVLSNRGIVLQEEVALTSGKSIQLQFALSDKIMERLRDLTSISLEDKPPAKYVDQVSDILIPLINKSYVTPRESFWIRHFDSVAVFAIVLFLLLISLMIIQHKFKTVLVFLLFLSTVWEWKRLYEEEVAKDRNRDTTGNKVCAQSSYKDWVQSLIYGTASLIGYTAKAESTLDQCNTYYSDKTILRVNPGLAISNVIGYFIGETFSNLASYAGKGYQNFFYHIPLFWTPVILALLFGLIFILLVFKYGYGIRTPLFSFVPNRGNLSFPRLASNSSSDALESNSRRMEINPPQTQNIIKCRTYNDLRGQRQPINEPISGDTFPTTSSNRMVSATQESSATSSIEYVDDETSSDEENTKLKLIFDTNKSIQRCNSLPTIFRSK